jgi:predicted Fe-S protein YdhL (DUF1289 family)
MKVCKGECKIDPQRDQCLTCMRTVDEITEARKMDICDGVSMDTPITTRQYDKAKRLERKQK